MASYSRDIILLFMAVMAGYYTGNKYGVFPVSLIISALTIIVVYYCLDFVYKRVTGKKA
ncbi:hypothetical protein J2128_000872 [Methanomicrobium sp. W14]|uniref:hypothetical protein n=1 Tax=Methanomicrobium sp. W14 TaxID=2817839 RepID=UPI001AEBA185|nr:hypothetical protein [Methanomicrobium sp. W14]MBP2132951.1 hypothetical protein [Methanomicrobium sp. W14]